MKKSLVSCIMLLIIMSFFSNCSSDDTPFITQEQELEELQSKYQEIKSMINVECIDSNSWKFTTLGTNSCNAPKEYIAYPVNSNTEKLLKKITEYNAAEQRFNSKWKIKSDCDTLVIPSGVTCTNGNPELIY